jgi:hypothetical protein
MALRRAMRLYGSGGEQMPPDGAPPRFLIGAPFMDGTKLRHVVLFGFRDGTSAAEIAEIARRFGDLARAVPGITAFEWGADNSPEGKAGGHSHCFVLTFESEAARDAYLPHPKHTEFVAFASQWIARALVVDYWARD